MTKISHLSHRGVVAVSGPQRVAFLNGLVSGDVAKVAEGAAVWAALLTPQGRYVTDFFVMADGERLLLDAPVDGVAGLVARLLRFRLRAEVAVADVTAEMGVYAAWDGPPPLPPAQGLCAPDPRLAAAGARLLSPQALECNASAQDYALHRLALGLPDGPPDLEPDKTLLLEAGFDELGGVDWNKGCYMGQELTARTKYRGLVKRRLVPVALTAPAPAPGTPVLAEGDEAEVGTIRSGADKLALAMLRVDALDKPLRVEGNALVVQQPRWLKLAGLPA